MCLYLDPLAALAPAGILSEDGRLIFKKPDDALVSCAELSFSVLEGERGGQGKEVGRKGLLLSVGKLSGTLNLAVLSCSL